MIRLVVLWAERLQPEEVAHEGRRRLEVGRDETAAWPRDRTLLRRRDDGRSGGAPALDYPVVVRVSVDLEPPTPLTIRR